FSPVFQGTRASGTQLLPAMSAKLSAAVSKSMGVCSSSTVSQSKPTRAIKRAETRSGKVSQVPTLGSPRFSFARAWFVFIRALSAKGANGREWNWRKRAQVANGSLSWETSDSAEGRAKFDNFGKGPSRCVERQADPPHPDPLPQGEG